MKSIKVVAAIIEKDGKILATQRGYGDMEGGWEFPGGKVEPGETSEQAIKREIEEELEAEINVGRLVCDVAYDYPTFHLDMDCFLCTLADGEITLLEHSVARWLDASTSARWDGSPPTMGHWTLSRSRGLCEVCGGEDRSAFVWRATGRVCNTGYLA